MKVSIAYRIYPKVSKVPAFHADDKYKLSEVCIDSFAKSLSNIDFHLNVLLDGCPDNYKELFLKYFDKTKVTFFEYNCVGNRETFKQQMDILLNQDFSENIYFAEDDYYYQPNSFSKMLEMIDVKGVDFVSPYDHPDAYNLELHNYDSRIKVCSGLHWRSVATTTMTFLTTKSILNQSRHIFDTYTKRNLDASLWLSATKFHLLSPLVFMFFLGPYGKIVKKAYIDGWGWIQILFRRKYYLYSPMPSIATHIEKDYLAPNINWEEIFDIK